MRSTKEQRERFGELLKAAREAHGWSLDDVAHKLREHGETGSSSKVSSWEKAKYGPSHPSIVVVLDRIMGTEGQLAEAYGLALDDEPVSISSADGIDFDEIRRENPEGWAELMREAQRLRDQIRGTT